MRYDTLTNGGLQGSDGGYTMVHEIGHWLVSASHNNVSPSIAQPMHVSPLRRLVSNLLPRDYGIHSKHCSTEIPATQAKRLLTIL
jgi:hypothetical protein